MLVNTIEEKWTPKSISLVQINDNLIDAIRPPVERSLSPVFLHPLMFSGRSTADKLASIRSKLFTKDNASNGLYILPVLPSIAWLLNIRCRDDVPNTPIFRSYLTLTRTECVLYADKRKISDEVEEALARDGVLLRPYGVEHVRAYVVGWKETEQGRDCKVLAPLSVSWGLVHQIKMAISVRLPSDQRGRVALTGLLSRKRLKSFRVPSILRKRSRTERRSKGFGTPIFEMEPQP